MIETLSVNDISIQYEDDNNQKLSSQKSKWSYQYID